MKTTNYLLALLLFLGWSCSEKNKDQETSSVEKKLVSGVKKGSTENDSNMEIYTSLAKYLEEVKSGMDNVPSERKKQLKKVALYIQTKKRSGEPANLVFICTHNSRRSHLSQIWAATAASYYGVSENVYTFSGGTEATAFNPRAVAVVQRAGFRVENPGGDNPHYKVTFSENGPVMECFSKKYDDRHNPTENFAAIMTCSDADKNCPFIPGANLRIPITYEDPKVADGTDYEAAKYDERCKQIATEMFYMMSRVSADNL